MDLAARATATTSRKGIADCQGDIKSIQPIDGNSPRETAEKKNREANVKEVPTHVLMLISSTRQSPENAGTPNRSGSCPRLLIRSLNPGHNNTMIKGTTTNICHVLTPGFLAPRVDTAGVNMRTTESSWSSELTAGETAKKSPDIAIDTNNATAETTAHRQEYLTVNPANKGFMRASNNSTVRDATRERKTATNMFGNWFSAERSEMAARNDLANFNAPRTLCQRILKCRSICHSHQFCEKNQCQHLR